MVDLEPLVAQDDAEHLRQCQVVVDDEHATLHVVPFLSPAPGPEIIRRPNTMSGNPPTAGWENPARERGATGLGDTLQQ
ncbi:hypothetical protein GCM10023168_30740 [Fodinibacter luteus]|uniref:Uncharacterized protein n=1 Tax=Fodinibacter luteus TaxID=552064 RepID=A0ABP8KP51_9MICO